MKNIRYLFVLGLLLNGCTPLQMSAGDVQKLGANEGVVVGSIQIVVREKRDDGRPYFLNHKDTTWRVEISPTPGIAGGNPTRELKVLSDTEEHFVSRLPAGEYAIYRASRGGLGGTATDLKLNARFQAHAGETTYVGRLRIVLPYSAERIGFFSGFEQPDIEVVDARDQSVAMLRPVYGNVLDKLSTHLMLLLSI